ncbi:hypothetical protein, partial [Pseudomonas viridiflava]|uniref:hypothetical protein n=1 Tax=Pseudomonas viridiflava TaxID=33069 RepID=UPI0019D2951B
PQARQTLPDVQTLHSRRSSEAAEGRQWTQARIGSFIPQWHRRNRKKELWKSRSSINIEEKHRVLELNRLNSQRFLVFTEALICSAALRWR